MVLRFVKEAVKVLDAAASQYGFCLNYTDALMGGCAIDAEGTPLPDETVTACKTSDAVLLGPWADISGIHCPGTSGLRPGCWGYERL